MDVEKLSTSVKNKDGLATFIWEYEKYKDPLNVNQYYPDAMKGTSQELHIPVFISLLQISGSTAD